MSDESSRLFQLWLSIFADKILRKQIRRRGDIANKINEALIKCDWDNLQLARQYIIPRRLLIATTFKIPIEIYEKVMKTAKEKGVSSSVIVESVLLQYYGNHL